MLQRLCDLIFPSLCLHCEMKIEQKNHLFCKGCSGFFELIDPSSRCPFCFAENGKGRLCSVCREENRWHVKMAAALDYLGSVQSLVKKLKYGHMPYLAKTAAAFMTAQFIRLKWPLPDLIVPIPRRHWFQGTNHAHLLAIALSDLLKVECASIIKRRAGDFSHAKLSRQQREDFETAGFYLKRNAHVEDKIILLVDDVVTTGTTLLRSAETLAQAFPANIYALTLASARFSLVS